MLALFKSSPLAPNHNDALATQIEQARHYSHVIDLAPWISVDRYISDGRLGNTLISVPCEQVVYVEDAWLRYKVRTPGRKRKTETVVSASRGAQNSMRDSQGRQSASGLVHDCRARIGIDPIGDVPAIIGLHIQRTTRVGVNHLKSLPQA